MKTFQFANIFFIHYDVFCLDRWMNEERYSLMSKQHKSAVISTHDLIGVNKNGNRTPYWVELDIK